MSAIRNLKIKDSAPVFSEGHLPVAMGYLARVQGINEGPDGCNFLLVADDASQNAQVAIASTADGLLLQPCQGDRVLCVQLPDRLVITQVLVRDNQAATLEFSSHRPIEWQSPVLRLKAVRELELLSAGRMTCYAKDMVMGVARTLVHQARHLINQVGDFSVTAKGLLRLNGKQQLITAEEDVRVDGKRINMG